MPTTDFLVIGSGIAGLTFALKVAEHGRVTVITKKTDTDSKHQLRAGRRGGGFRRGRFHRNPHRRHHRGRRRAVPPRRGGGDGREGPALVQELYQTGVQFTTSPGGGFDMGQEGGHSRRRIVHARDFTGFEIERVLAEQARKHPTSPCASTTRPST